MDQANTETYKGHQLLNLRFNYCWYIKIDSWLGIYSVTLPVALGLAMARFISGNGERGTG
jgi:hypothetical protein